MTSRVFPRNLFMVWYQGCENMKKPHYRLNFDLWKRLNPEWEVKCINDSQMREACSKVSPRCLKIYENIGMQIQIDLGRLALLYTQGGFYVDMDAYVMRPLSALQPLTDLLERYEQGKSEHVMTVSRMPLNYLESNIFCRVKTCVNNALVLSSQSNPLILEYINIVLDNCEYYMKRNEDMKSMKMVILTSGPSVFGNFFGKKAQCPPLKSEVVVFEPEIFEPCHSASSDCNITDNTIAVHRYENSWVSKPLKMFIRIYTEMKEHEIYWLLLIGLSFYIFSQRKRFSKKHDQ